MNSNTGFKTKFQARKIRAPQANTARVLRIPGLGRMIMTHDDGDSSILSREVFASNLSALHLNSYGELKHVYNLGSGLVTNVGVMAMANDFAWFNGGNTLKLANNHATGTGTTSASTSDIQLQSPAAPTTTTTVTGTQSLVSAANSQIYKTVATVNYTSSLAITEWGLFTGSALSITTGSPATATTATSLTATGTPYTASSSTVQGEQQNVVKTGTTASYGLIVNNTTGALTIPAWYKTADGTAGTTPGSTEAFTIQPVMWDHKVFAAINVVNGDSIQFSYSLTIQSGG